MGRARSVLFLPASNPRAVEKARGLDCDVAVLDLEDAVGPDAKVEARAAAVEAVRSGGFRARLGVRINGLDTPWGADDLEALSGLNLDLVVAPKVDGPADIADLSGRLAPGVRLWAMIETPLALLSLPAIAASGGPLEALMLGVNDLAKALRTGPSPDREPLKPWLAALVATAHAHGLLAIDGVFNRHQDEGGFLTEAEQARLYGFDGKSLIHPLQIALCHKAFAATPEQLNWARAVVAAFDGSDQGVVSVQGEMVERLHLDAAAHLLASLSPRGEGSIE